MQEPYFDAERLKTDKAYRYSMLDVFTAYMETLSDYVGKVEYFMKITLSLNLPLPALNIGSLKIFERDYWTSEEVHPVLYLDKEGNRVGLMLWGCPKPTNDTEKALSRKLWFIKVRHIQYPSFRHWSNESLAEREARYYANCEGWNHADYARLQLSAVNSMINQFQADYTSFKEEYGSTASNEPDSIKTQRLNAPALIESELIGNPAINWLAFNRSAQLQSFGILWDMVGFKLFIMKQIDVAQPTSAIKDIDEPADRRNKNERTQNKARRAISFFEDRIKDVATPERGKQRPKPVKEIADQAIIKYCELAINQNYAATEKGIGRYLKDVGIQQTAKEYARQVVRQIIQGK